MKGQRVFTMVMKQRHLMQNQPLNLKQMKVDWKFRIFCQLKIRAMNGCSNIFKKKFQISQPSTVRIVNRSF